MFSFAARKAVADIQISYAALQQAVLGNLFVASEKALVSPGLLADMVLLREGKGRAGNTAVEWTMAASCAPGMLSSLSLISSFRYFIQFFDDMFLAETDLVAVAAFDAMDVAPNKLEVISMADVMMHSTFFVDFIIFSPFVLVFFIFSVKLCHSLDCNYSIS